MFRSIGLPTELAASLLADTGAEFPGATTRKRGGRPKGSLSGHSRAIRDAVDDLQDEYREVTVRQAFYALTVRGIVEKTEGDYRRVQRQILEMRRHGLLPWEFIADGTRWQRKPHTYDDHQDFLRGVAQTYRRNLWQRQKIRIEVWLEKDALAAIVQETTVPWDVALMVSRGQSSDTFCYSAAQAAREAWEDGVQTHVFALYDADHSGRTAAAKIREKLVSYSDGTPIEFQLLAVTDEQIEAWKLPTRPAKENAAEIAVELDAIPPDRLVSLVDAAIAALVDQKAWEIEQAYEASERAILERIVGDAA
jgi:hypothetical protein